MAERIEIKVPDIGDFENVEVIDVLVQARDKAEDETPVINLQADEAALEVPAPQAGPIVEMKVGNGDKVSEGSVIAVLEVAEGGVQEAPAPAETRAEAPKQESAPQPAPAEKPKAASEAPAKTEAPALPAVDETSFSRAHASPSVRRFARDRKSTRL